MKGFKPSDWPRAIVSPLSTMLSQAVSGFGAKHRRKVQLLRGALAEVEAECDRLRQEMQELVQYTDAELNQIKQERDRLQQERDELYLKVLLLEDELETITLATTADSSSSHNSNTPEASAISPSPAIAADAIVPTPSPNASSTHSSPASFSFSSKAALPSSETARSQALLDLSDFRLALVGGHPTTRRGVIQELQVRYGLKHFVEIPRMSEANTSRNRVKSKIYRCNLVVLITGYMSHRLTEIVFSLKDAGVLAGDVLQLNCKGKSGVLRGIIEHVESKAT